MTRTDFMDYLIAHGCEIVREDKKGYSVVRNSATRKISGVPVTDPPLNATACRICKTLDVPTPDAVKNAQELIDRIHDRHNGVPNESEKPR